MKYLLGFLILLFFGLIQSSLIPVGLILILVILYSVNVSVREAFVWAFVGGLLTDILLGRPVGLSSLAFLGSAFILGLYRRKFKHTHVLYLAPFTLIMYITISLMFRESINLFTIGFAMVFFIILLPLVRIFFLRFEKEGEQLELKIQNDTI